MGPRFLVQAVLAKPSLLYLYLAFCTAYFAAAVHTYGSSRNVTINPVPFIVLHRRSVRALKNRVPLLSPYHPPSRVWPHLETWAQSRIALSVIIMSRSPFQPTRSMHELRTGEFASDFVGLLFDIFQLTRCCGLLVGVLTGRCFVCGFSP